MGEYMGSSPGELITTSAAAMKLILVILAVLCIHHSQAEQDYSSFNKHLRNIQIDDNSIIFNREKRSPERKSNERTRKVKRKNKKRKGKGKRNMNKKKLMKRKHTSQKNIQKKKVHSKVKSKGKKKQSRKSHNVRKTKKIGKKPRKSLTTIKSQSKETRISGRKALKGTHCQFVDLCVIDRMSESGCNMGQKFVIKSVRGTRRQFLMVDGSKIIAFLEKGKKITDCGGNLTDVTSKVSCKTIPGAAAVKLSRQNGTTAAAPAAPTTAAAPAPAPPTDSMPPLQAGQIHCPCFTRTCVTQITSTNNKHKIECGGNTFSVACGGPLMGSKIGLLISIIDVFEHKLCTTNTYVTLIKDLVWKCDNLDVSEDDSCDATPAPTMETAISMGPAPTTTTAPDVTTTTVSAETTTTASAVTTTTVSADTTTTAAETTTTTASDTTTTTASVTTTTTASVTTTTAAETTTTTASATTTTASATTTTT